MPIKAMIIDDERLARNELKKLLEQHPEIEIIGEAVNRLTSYKNVPIKIQNARQIIGTRNRLAHEYDNISDENIWSILTNHLPKLKLEVNAIIKENEKKE